MTKNILLAATAASVMAFAGAASAHTLSFRATSTNPTAIVAADVGGNGFLLAEEALADVSGEFALAIDLNGASTFPSGNSIIQLDLFGGEWGDDLTSAAVVAAGCTVVLSSGGEEGGTTARFLVSSSGAGCGGADLNLPVAAGASGDVVVRSTLETEAGSPIDPDPSNTTPTLGIPTADNQEVEGLIERVDAFQVVINGGFTASADDADADTFARLTPATYIALGGDNVLGTVLLSVNEDAHYDLDPAANVSVGDVDDVEVTVMGNFDAFDDNLDDAELDGNDADSIEDGEAVFEGALYIVSPESAEDPADFTVNPDGDIIQTSDYKVEVEYELDDTKYNEDEPMPAKGDFERIQREGTNVILPWMNSTRIQTINGTSNFVRIANLSSEDAPVSVDVRTSSAADSGYSDAGIKPLGTVPAGGELQITTATLSALMGDFGRGDVELIIEADPSDITVRRFLVRPEGITELNSGTVASDQTPDDATDVP